MKPEDTITQEIQKIANENDVLILSFVAPDRAVKVSPIGVIYVSIDVDDLYEIEKVIETLEEEGRLPKKLHLVIQTPGGLVSVSTKIAKYLRDTFEEVHAFVPYEAASGGTVLCLAANKITMGNLANLTPIDPQLSYEGTRVSAVSYQFTVNKFESKFGRKRPAEIPPPYQQMCDKLDPVILTEMNKFWQDAADVATNLLEKSYNPDQDEAISEKITDTVLTLTYNVNPHGHIIDAQDAERIGLVIDKTEESNKLLKTYKKWVKSMLDEEQVSHIIQSFCPKVKKQGDDHGVTAATKQKEEVASKVVAKAA